MVPLKSCQMPNAMKARVFAIIDEKDTKLVPFGNFFHLFILFSSFSCASFSSQNWISVRFNFQLQTDVVQNGFKALYTTKFNRFSISVQSSEINHYSCIVIELNVALYFEFFFFPRLFIAFSKGIKARLILYCFIVFMARFVFDKPHNHISFI